MQLAVTNWFKEKIRVHVDLHVVKHTQPNDEEIRSNTPLATLVR